MALFSKKNQNPPAADTAQENENKVSRPAEEETPVASVMKDSPFGSFVMGVLDVFSLKEDVDVVVVGRIIGRALPEDAVYVTSLGNDDEAIIFTNLAGIEVDNKKVPFAKDGLAAVRVRNGYRMNLKPGSVIFTRDQGPDQVRKAYLNALGEYYIQKKNMQLGKADRENLSLTDCVELSRIFRLYLDQIKANMTDADRKESDQRLQYLKEMTLDKLFNARSIYTVVNKKTTEPHMFSVTVPLKNQEGSYYCAPPDVRLITKAYVKIFGPMYDAKVYEIREIANDEVERNRIREFLDQIFHLNGAEAITLIYDNVGFTREELEPRLDREALMEGSSDESNKTEDERAVPITNPALERWILLLSQTDPESSSQADVASRLYYRFMTKELANAKFLIPISDEVEKLAPEENKETVVEAGASLKLPVVPGRNEKPATLLFTDWRRLRADYSQENALVQTLDEVLERMDCVINLNKATGTGIYLSKETYEQLKALD